MPGGRIGGSGNLPTRALWVFVACCIVVAVWNTFPHTPRGFAEELGRKSDRFSHVARDAADWVERLVPGGNNPSNRDPQPTKRASGNGARNTNG